MAEDGVTREEVLAALDRLSAWPDMARSPQIVRFLDYIVKHRLDDDIQSIKAYSIAVDVFGRSADFDPQSDPIVRVQARRMRQLLDQYYAGPGAEDSVRIVLPVGRYVPDFVEHVVEPADVVDDEGSEPDLTPTARRGHVTVSWLVLLVIAIGAAALAYSLSTWGPRQDQQVARNGAIQQPSIRIMEFQNLTDDPTITAAVAGLAVDLVDRMQTLNFLNVDYGGRGEIGGQALPKDGYTLTGIVRRDPATQVNYQYSVLVTEVATNNVIWNRTMVVSGSQLADTNRIEALSIDITSVLGSARGPLHARARHLLMQGAPTGGESPYVCRIMFSIYRETMTAAAADRTQACYAALPEQDQNNGIALAAVASIIAEAPGNRDVTPAARLGRYREAGDMLVKAVQALPTSSFVWEQRARLYEAMAEHALAEAAYGTALQTNPANLDAVAAHARHLAFIGRLDQAEPLAERSLSGPTTIPDWYYGVPALAALETGDFSQAEQFADTYARADREVGPILAILAAQGQGDEEQVAKELPRVLEVPSFRAGGIITQLRRRITDTALLDRIRMGLAEAGVPQMSLVTAF
ncbi:hypothetical protein ASG47_13640 [Devosia sp. Leaf420]|uniref:tetratricopeptide repeat protein n=1 Tax=Devosia sp. Leaf420 TaxID=1736374 RepID=UPI0007133CBC|nr:hypothetical protein [Devosia sp. Leaf420]KQT45980.1 hypothetical protein ASG47_13640 [Devosia sp. Leaf420]